MTLLKLPDFSRRAPVFLFSNWRTGGTALAFSFRKVDGFYVYTEPFNPSLHDPGLALRANTSNWDSKHPADEYYFTEFEDLLRSKSFVFPRFEELPYMLKPEDECPILEGYLRALIDHAQKNDRAPVFKLEQSEGSAPWLSARFPEGLRVGLSRNPIAQLASWMEQASLGNHLFFSLAHRLIAENPEFFNAGSWPEFAFGDIDLYERIFSVFHARIEAQHRAFMHFNLDISPETSETIDEQLDRVALFDSARLPRWQDALRHIRRSLQRESVPAAKLKQATRLIAEQTTLADTSKKLAETSQNLIDCKGRKAALSERVSQLEQALARDRDRVSQLEQAIARDSQEVRLWEARAHQLAAELGTYRPLLEERSMDLLKAFAKRIRRHISAVISSRSVPTEPAKPTEPTEPSALEPSSEIFDRIYRTNYWRGESRSGEGSDLIQTALTRQALPPLVQAVGAKTILDIPCGDYFWMQHVDLPAKYIGADIVLEIIRNNQERYGDDRHSFVHLDVCEDKLPCVDLIFSRDLLVHLSYKDIGRALRNMKASGSRWLLTTTFTDRDANCDIATGDWRTLNLQLAPFHFPKPAELINEGCTQFGGDYNDKSLGLWKLEDLLWP